MDLLDWTPPPIKGSTFNLERDGQRLSKQSQDVYNLMKDGVERTLSEISKLTGHPEASCSARLRDIRRMGLLVIRRYIKRGLHGYTVKSQ